MLNLRWRFLFVAALGLLLGAGCGSTTNRAGIEQLLMSDAVDSAVAQLDFRAFSGEKIYLETTYLNTLKSESFVNAPYIISSLRQQLTAAGCLLVEKPEEASIVFEPRVGALGTNGHEIVYGLPRNNFLSSAASVIPGAPPIPALPEISLARTDANSGVAKIMVFAYDRESREPLWQSGVARAEATSRSSWVFGAGPLQRGTVHNGVRFAGSGLTPNYEFSLLDEAPGIDYSRPYLFSKDIGKKAPPPRVADAEAAESQDSQKPADR